MGVCRKLWTRVAIGVLVAAAACARGSAHTTRASAPTAWLCRPGGIDACATDLTTTAIDSDGALSLERSPSSDVSRADCFAVYPTVSRESAVSSDLTAAPEVVDAARQQFARFSQRCRLFVPLYRQITLAGIATLIASRGTNAEVDRAREIAYADVRAAWHDYLAHDNRGRPFVLIGHSQGAAMLVRLLQEEIDGKPLQARLLSAILVGQNILVPRGRDVGGTFRQLSLCRAAAQTGCIITYATFPSTAPPLSDAMFGRVSDTAMIVACTNPAGLGGGVAPLRAYLTADRRTVIEPGDGLSWTRTPDTISTPWVTVPGLLVGRCASNANASQYFEVSVRHTPSDLRNSTIHGDLRAAGRALPNWGWHLLDLNIAQGDLLDVIGQETTAYVAR